VRHSAHKEYGKSHHRILAHKTLFNDYGILHRDISLNNILLHRAKEDGPADGLLIDFDYSEEVEPLDNVEHPTEECEVRINEEAVTGPSVTDSIRTVSSHFIIVHCDD
jgi:serine/threonine protein kinase